MGDRILVYRPSVAVSPGTYQRAVQGGVPTAKIMCPKCTLPLWLTDHTIGVDGRVEEGIVCPCGWQGLVRLAEWGK